MNARTHSPDRRDDDAPAAVVPEGRETCEAWRARVRTYVAEHGLVPPLSMEELRAHATRIVHEVDADPRHEDFAAVLLGNAVWRDTVAAVPYERRVLLLPQCLRHKATCPAALDEFGLLCEECGNCPIGALQHEAEALGYVVLIAEGTTVVTKLLEGGKVDAVIGVSCLSALERSFPHMADGAIPGMAVPLTHDGCADTTVDEDWLHELIRLKSEEPWHGRLDIDALRLAVREWFTPAALAGVMGNRGGLAWDLCLKWMAKSGKRWRPLLTTCIYKALTEDTDSTALPPELHELAVAIECFHKASLIHDDIEDDDRERYGERTLHHVYGIPVALNAGDLLLGEGYRLITACGAPPEQVVRMLASAAKGHRDLCLGQGEELAWMRSPASLSMGQVIEIFRRKTAPAFEVALTLGAIRAGADDELCRMLGVFSEALGIAYQIRDDLDDFHGDGDTDEGDASAARPSLLFALACDHADKEERTRVLEAWQSGSRDGRRRALAAHTDLERKAWQLLEHYRNEAVRSLTALRQAHVKSLLRHMVGRILGAPPHRRPTP